MVVESLYGKSNVAIAIILGFQVNELQCMHIYDKILLLGSRIVKDIRS